MKPLRLRLRNFRTFPALDLELGTGVVGILGELRDAPEGADSNGAGKSSILEAIDIALWGRRSLSGYLTRGGDADEVMVELVFSHNASTYRVRRSYSPKGRGVTKVDLERMGFATEEDGVDYAFRQPQMFEALTQATARETDALLQDILGLSQQTFRDSAYLRQGDGGYADPARDPKQRKELLVEAVLGRDPVWPKLAAVAGARRLAAEGEVVALNAELARLQEIAATAGDCEVVVRESAAAVSLATETLAYEEGRLRAAEQEQQAARERALVRAQARLELDTALVNLSAVKERSLTAELARVDSVAVRAEIASLATPEQLADLEANDKRLRADAEAHAAAVAAHERATADRDAALVRVTTLRETAASHLHKARGLRNNAIDALNDADVGGATCDRCGQTLGVEAAGKVAASYRHEAVLLERVASEREAEAALIAIPDVDKFPEPPEDAGDAPIVASHLELARGQQQTRGRLEERLASLEAVVAPTTDELEQARGQVQDARDRFEAIPPDTNPDGDQTAMLEILVASCRSKRDLAIADEATAKQKLSDANLASVSAQGIAETTEIVRAAIDRDVLLEKAYGRDGIPALIIENTAIPYIEAEATRILRALGTGFDVQLRTQAEKKSGGLRDTLDVVVIDPDGNEADYADGCSGGEQTRIGLALRIALARLLASRRGAESRLLALDEPSYLDAAGMTALLEVLRGLDSEFDLILLVSHVAELRDALDETITVVKSGGVSSIVGDREAVAA